MSACHMPSAVLDVPHDLPCFILTEGPLSVKSPLWKAPPPKGERSGQRWWMLCHSSGAKAL